jgi:hypothetical protein
LSLWQQERKDVDTLPQDYWEDEVEKVEEPAYDYRDRWNKLHNTQVKLTKYTSIIPFTEKTFL